MNDIAIRVENLSKLYRIGSAKERNKTLREAMTDMVAAPWRFMKNALRQHPVTKQEDREYIWALKDVSFDVQRGEVVGIIGRNGAGKSTLLKILARITEPTEGRVIMRGRVGSLLEVGTGFHSELTGEENIYLSGTILGMSSNEISRKFDEIVAFAEMEKFIYTPVKYYSSGMSMRLAFAVAAHLDPEILIIDEVLAVGDAHFQKKCLGKMEDISTQEGRTVLFVSHNMGTIRHLCSKGILLDEGKISYSGTSAEAISHYEKGMYSIKEGTWVNDEKTKKDVYLERIELRDRDNNNKSHFLNSEIIQIEMHTHAIESTNNVKLGFDLIKQGIIVLRTQQIDSLDNKYFHKGEKNVFTCEVPRWTLNVGEYFIRPLLSIHCVESLTAHTEPVLSFKVDIDPGRSEFHGYLNENNNPGGVFLMLDWRVN